MGASTKRPMIGIRPRAIFVTESPRPSAPAAQSMLDLSAPPRPRVATAELFPEDEPATEKQRQYIGRLIDDIGWHSEELAVYAHEQQIDLVAMTKAQASAFIDGLKRLAHPEPADVRAALTATPCRVCAARIAAYAPAKLCPACLSDLATTRAHVEQALDTSYATLRNAEAAWNSFVDSADDATRGRWERARGLLASGAVSDAFTRTWTQEIGACTALGYILKAYDTLRAAEQAAHELTVWHAAAMREIATAMESEALL